VGTATTARAAIAVDAVQVVAAERRSAGLHDGAWRDRPRLFGGARSASRGRLRRVERRPRARAAGARVGVVRPLVSSGRVARDVAAPCASTARRGDAGRPRRRLGAPGQLRVPRHRWPSRTRRRHCICFF